MPFSMMETTVSSYFLFCTPIYCKGSKIITYIEQNFDRVAFHESVANRKTQMRPLLKVGQVLKKAFLSE